ncbi:MAG: hypothetical protein ACR2NN_25960 [Bryobacteraceae bacterium]
MTAGSDDGNPWLTAVPIPGSANKFTVSMDPAGLALGQHNGIVTVTRNGDLVPFTRNNFSLNVGSVSMIQTDTIGLNLDATYFKSAIIHVASGSPSVPVTVRSSDSLLSVTPVKGTTPLTLTAQLTDPSALPTGDRTATITIQGPGNTLTIQTNLFNSPIGLPPITIPDVTFSSRAGSEVAVKRDVAVPYFSAVEAATSSGGDWLSAKRADYSSELEISANPSGLTVGTYRGTVTIYLGSPASDSITVSVVLFVWTDPTPPPSASPSSLQFTTQAGQSVQLSQLLTISTGSLPLPLSIGSEADNGLRIFSANYSGNSVTPHSEYITASADYPGVYHGRLIFTAPPGSNNSVTVPLTLTVTPAPAIDGVPPLISSIVSAASLLPGSIAPGEIVSIFGITEPDVTSGPHLGWNGKVTTSSYGNRILFNGIPAPLTYSSATQINAVVPYEISGSAVATVELDMSGIHSAPWGLPVAPSAPGLFTQSGTGFGAAAILNQDDSLNAPENPATPGSIIQIFLTGVGQTTPPGITGEVTQSETKNPLLMAAVQIAGTGAKVVSATAAPNTVSGLFQINAQIQSASASGTVPVLVRIGSTSSQATATVSVK